MGSKKSKMAAVGATVCLALAACGGSGGGGSSDEVRIGVIFPLTGNMAAAGNDGLDAIRVAADIYNDETTGPKVKIVAANATTAAEAQAAVQRLVTQQDVKIIMGTTLSLLGIPASAQADRLGAIYWDTIDASPVISDRGLKNVFQLMVQGGTTGAAGSDYVKDVIAPTLGKPVEELKVGVINTNDEYGAAVGDGMISQAEEIGLNIVTHEQYEPEITDLSSIILKLKDADVEVLLASTLASDAVLLNKQMRQADFNPIVVDGLGYDNPESAKALGDCINGVFLSSTPQSKSIDPDQLTEEGARLYDLYAAGYEKATNKATSVDSDGNFSGAWAFFKYVLEEAPDPTDVDAMAEVARKLDLPLGALPNGFGIQFDENQYNQRTVVAMNQFQEQEEFAVYPPVVAAAEPIMVPRPSWDEVCGDDG